MPALRERLVGFRLVLECASYVTVILGIPFFICEQMAERRAHREEMAMKFVALTSEPSYIEAREHLVAPFRPFDMTKRPNAASLMRIVSGVSDRYIEQMQNFYSSVIVCEQTLCDKDIIEAFFKKEVYLFYCNYESRFTAIRKRLGRPDYALDLEGYAGPCPR